MAKLPPIEPLPSYLAERYRLWRHRRFAESRAWFARLAESGQHPRAMVVSCCDSRIDTGAMFGAEPGDLFVVRNVANLVPPHEPDHSHHGTSAAVEYAVTVLGVAHVIVVGHAHCGGVAACHAMCRGETAAPAGDESYVARWMDLLRPAWDRVAAIADDAERQRALEQEGVLTSLRNLASFPFVSGALADSKLTLHGAWMDIATGLLHVFEPGRGFVPLAPDPD